jgi:Spy/CpxP family protein refolding chaperone
MRKQTITTIAAIAILLSSLPTASARAAGIGQTSSPSGRLQKFKQALEQLDLSSSQKQQIKQVLSGLKAKMESSKTAGTGASETKTQARQIMKDAVQKIIAILKPAQRMKLRQIMQASRSG